MDGEHADNHVENNVNNNNNDLPGEIVATHVTGSVKWFQRAKGFGYITRDDTKEEIYVHRTALVQPGFKPTREKRRLNLVDNERLEFDVVKKGDTLSATNVTGVNGYQILDLVAFNRGVPTKNSQIVSEARVTGKVKWFNTKDKFGYILCDSNNEDVYVNATAIAKNNTNKLKPSLAEGEVVEFDLFKRPDGKFEAVNVTGPNGTEVKGSDKAPEKVDKSTLNYVSRNLTGKCKWFNVKSGFGYIRRDDNGEDIYCNVSAIDAKNPAHDIASLGDNEPVVFSAVQTDKGLEAADVTGPNGATLKGSNLLRRGGRRARSANGDRQQPQQQGGRPGQQRNQSRNNNNNNRNNRRRQLNGSQSPPPPPQRQQQQQRRGVPLQQQRGGGRGGARRVIPNGVPLPPRYANNRNVYDNAQYYDQDEPLYLTFKPKTKSLYTPMNAPRRISYDRYMDMIDRPQQPPRGPPRQRIERVAPTQGQILVAERVPGFAKWFNYTKGFGYITRYDNRQDVYVHRTNLGQIMQKGVRVSLDEREEVEFDIVQDGPVQFAVNVTGPGGALLVGSRYAKQGQQQQQQQQESDNNGVQTKVYRRKRESSQRN